MNDLLIKAVAATIEKNPSVNVQWDDKEAEVNIFFSSSLLFFTLFFLALFLLLLFAILRSLLPCSLPPSPLRSS